MDVNILRAVSTNGYVPVMFPLTLIAHCGKQSWYMMLLSFSVLGLSTWFLVYFWCLSKSFQSLSVSPLTTFSDKYMDRWNLGMYCGGQDLEVLLDSGVDPVILHFKLNSIANTYG